MMMMVLMMVVVVALGSKRWAGKNHQEEYGGKYLLHGTNLARSMRW